MEKPYPCIMFKNNEYISCAQAYLKKQQKKQQKNETKQNIFKDKYR